MKQHRKKVYHPSYSTNTRDNFVVGVPFFASAVGALATIVQLCAGRGWSSLWAMSVLALWIPFFWVVRQERGHEAVWMTNQQLEVYDLYWALSSSTRAQVPRPTQERLDSITDWELRRLHEELYDLKKLEEKQRAIEFQQASPGTEWIRQVKEVRLDVESLNRQLERG